MYIAEVRKTSKNNDGTIQKVGTANPVQFMKSYRVLEVKFHSFLTWVSGEAEWSHSCADRITSWKIPAHTYGIHGWVSHSAGLGAFEKIKFSCVYRESKSEISVARPVAYNSIETKCVKKTFFFFNKFIIYICLKRL